MTSTEQLELEGFALVEGVLSSEQVASFVSLLNVDGPCESTSEESLRVKRGSIFARRNLLQVPEIAELARAESLMSLVRPVLQGTARAVRAILFDKTPNANWVVPWHQDLSIAVKERLDAPGFGPWSVKSGVVHVQPPLEVLSKMLTVRLHLDDCGLANGPLRVIPRSHVQLLRDAALNEVVQRGPQVSCCTGAGGAVLMRPMILHASSPAEQPGHRRVIHIEYAAGPLPHGLEWYVDAA